MGEGPHAPLPGDRIGDSEAGGAKPVCYLDLADYLLIAEAVLRTPAEALARAERVVALAESALHAPDAAYAGVEFYPDFADKVAVLGARLIKNHPLPDGNKRTAWLCMVEFAERNGRALAPSDPDDVVDTLVGLAAGRLNEQDFGAWVRRHLQ